MENSRRRLITLCTVQFVDVMGVTVVVSALPRMLADLGGSAAQAGLLVPVYAVGFSSLLLLAARLGDRWGHRRVLIAGLLLFAAGSVIAAVAPTMTALVVGRGIQGVAAAVSVPNALVLLTRAADSQSSKDRALGAWNATGGLAGAAGLLVGGLTTSAVSWRAIFWGNLVVTAALIAVLLRLVERDPRAERTPAGFDPRSVVLQVIAVAAIVAAANTTTEPWPVMLALVLSGVLAASLLVRRERRTASPLVAASLWRPKFVAGLVGSFGITATTSAFVVLGTIYLQEDEGFSPASAGLMILPFSLSVVLAAGLAGRLMPRTGARLLLVLGLALILAGAGLVGWRSGSAALVAGLLLAGLGNGMGAVAAYGLGTAVPADQQGSAAGLLNTAAQVGTATMVAIAVAVAGHGGGLDYTAGWLTVVITAAVVTAHVVAVTRHRVRRPSAA
ncbi:MFS transporter [Kribbella sp. CA-293567]|uniref:MFS transporter n=1 Tax=Kribbella sp. CA-293567 TaxID=3002436 RepID=UPI0022DD99E2|nr:MFS transporter [Kribbella sp. CA-293567]WBQ04486.1 MFS transporter [Kribbella sp. CA-293567]